jgi:two-component system OmpR family sensor kinase
VLWVLASAVTTLIVQHELSESFDRALVETAHRLLPLAVDSVRDNDEEKGVYEIHRLSPDRDSALVYQLRREGGPLVLRSEDAPTTPFSAPIASGFADTQHFRVFTLADPTSQFAIQVAEPLAHRQVAILRSIVAQALPLLLLIPLSIIGVLVAIRRGLAPLRTLQSEIAARDSANLAPLEVAGLPRELTPIAGALARLIDRLRAAFESERHFAANSAHELRTPIAAALAQTQRLIETAHDERARAEARKIEATLRRLADLAEKLIQLARADAGIAATDEPVAVLPIVRLVIADCRSRARPTRDLVLETRSAAEGWHAKINVDALAIVLRNLIDNAIAHSRPDTTVTIVVENGRIAIRNAAPVVPAEALKRLTNRFERGATPASGSGLGLAIVETILAQIGGALTLHSPARGSEDGFEAVVDIPTAPYESAPRPHRAALAPP